MTKKTETEQPAAEAAETPAVKPRVVLSGDDLGALMRMVNASTIPAAAAEMVVGLKAALASLVAGGGAVSANDAEEACAARARASAEATLKAERERSPAETAT